MSGHKPTPEQAAIIDAATTGAYLTIEAGAGTGKTSTLRMLAAEASTRKGAYLAYNRAIAQDAAQSFPTSVTCKTAHAFAFGAVGRQYAHRLNGPRVPARQAAIILGLNDPVKVGEVMLSPEQIARLVTETVGRFCYSADEAIRRRHVPLVNGLDRPGQAELARYLTPIAQKAWDTDLTQQAGRLRFTHDMYLKMWILSRPQLGVDYVLLDEAQDSNPAVAGLVADQQAQQILVGDRSQAIYGWRGAVDAMASFGGERFQLSQSFRFGPAIAGEANKWLGLLDAPLRLSGYDAIASTVEPLASPDAILCRSNAGALIRAMGGIDQGRKVALVGGGGDIRRMAEAARKLMIGCPTDHPELFAFSTWQEVQDYAEHDSGGSDLKVFVRLIDRHGADTVIQVCDALVDERYADLVVSTAHKAKGREWKSVRIADDFQEPRATEDNPHPTVPREDAMLAYVAVTRARKALDRSGLAWVDNWVSGPAPAAIMPDSPADGLSDGLWPLPAVEVEQAEAAGLVVRPESPAVELPEPGPEPEVPAGPVCPVAGGCVLCRPERVRVWPAPVTSVGVAR